MPLDGDVELPAGHYELSIVAFGNSFVGTNFADGLRFQPDGEPVKQPTGRAAEGWPPGTRAFSA